MPSTLTRRPVPALVALVALLLLTGLVWWRVLGRDSGSGSAKSCSTPSSSSTAAAVTTLPATSSITVQVLNSTDRTGIAASARTALATAGFNVPAQASNDTARHNKILGGAEIRYTSATAAAAKTLSYYVYPKATLVLAPGSSTTVVLSLGAKYTGIATAAQASVAMAKNHVQVGSSTPTPSGGASPSC